MYICVVIVIKFGKQIIKKYIFKLKVLKHFKYIYKDMENIINFFGQGQDNSKQTDDNETKQDDNSLKIDVEELPSEKFIVSPTNNDEEQNDEEQNQQIQPEEDEKDDDESDDSDDSDDDDFRKLEQDMKRDILINYHPEVKQISNEELITLSTVSRDKNGQIIDELHKTIPILTRYEKARILGLRAKQINNGSNPFIKVPRDMLNGIRIAEKELEEKKIPFIIRRPLPNGGSEYWDINDLEILD